VLGVSYVIHNCPETLAKNQDQKKKGLLVLPFRHHGRSYDLHSAFALTVVLAQTRSRTFSSSQRALAFSPPPRKPGAPPVQDNNERNPDLARYMTGFFGACDSDRYR